jgi:regulator of nucleoside diphosphate kinase
VHLHLAPRTDRPPSWSAVLTVEKTMRTNHHDLIVTNIDVERLRPMLDHYDTAVSESLDSELHRALIVDQQAVPPDVVTMNSEVVYEDCDTFTKRRVKVVYPKDADASRGFVSVLAPIGSAILGLRVNQSIEWEVPSGTKRIRVLEIQYQPEACGDFDR